MQHQAPPQVVYLPAASDSGHTGMLAISITLGVANLGLMIYLLITLYQATHW